MADNGSNQIDVEELLRDLEKVDPLAENLAKRTQKWMEKVGVPRAYASTVAAFVGAQISLTLSLVSLAVTILVFIGTPLVRVFLRVLTKTRTDTVPEQIEISASVLSEFLAAEITPEHLKTGKSGDQTIDAARGIGDALIGRLTKEFAPQGTVTPESGEEAAKTFAGYSVNFSVQNTMIGTLADALSFHFLEDFRDLGVDVARNIGLGRLVRQALLPLIRNTIAEPYDQALRKRYRPDLLTEQHAVDAANGGFIDQDTLTDILQRKGYSDAFIAVVRTQLRKKLNADQVEALQRAGEIDADLAKSELLAAGYDAAMADRVLKFQRLQRTDGLVTLYKNLISKQRIDGLIDEDAYNKLLDRLPITDEERALERNFVGASLEVPRQFLTWSEVENAYALGAVDLEYVDAWLQREGYSEDDQLVKELLLLNKVGNAISKEMAKEAKAARKKA